MTTCNYVKNTQNNQQEIIMTLLIINENGNVNEEFLVQLRLLNGKKQHLNNNVFFQELQKLFNIDKTIKITSDYKRFLGGFILGEGSLNASVKKKGALGVMIDLEFSVTQSYLGVSHLINLMSVFQTGRIDYKSGSKATFVYDISNRKSIFEKVFPFWEEYILPYQTNFEAGQRYFKFKKFKELFDLNCHQNKEGMINQMLPLWDSLRKQKGQKNQSFSSLEEAQNFVLNY